MGTAQGIRLKKQPPSRMRSAFLERAQKAIQQIADEVPEEMLTEALAAGSDIGTLARLIGNPRLRDPALEIDPLAPARARALQHRKEVAQEAGAMLTVAETTDILGISRQALDKRRKSGAILGVRVGTDWRYPEVQFQDGTLLPRLREVLKAHHTVDGWVILDSIIGKDPASGNRSIIDLLREQDDEMLDRAILDVEEQFAP